MPLRDELAAWREAGLAPRLWLRDDDLIEPTEALAKLGELTGANGCFVLIAIIPARASPSLPLALATLPHLFPCQHGWDHSNRAGADQPPTEFPPGRLLDGWVRLLAGRNRLRDLFRTGLIPVFVPPWNRVEAEVLAALPRLGFIGASGYGSYPAVDAASDVVVQNADLDMLNWNKREGKFPAALSAREVARQIAEGLAARRREGPPGQPFGLLTHHRAMGPTAWAVLADTLATLSEGGAVWQKPADVFQSHVTNDTRAT